MILPCFNGAATTTVQLEALTGQDWPGGWELIVVNNGSTDCSMAIVEACRHRLPVLRIVEAHVPGTPRPWACRIPTTSAYRRPRAMHF